MSEYQIFFTEDRVTPNGKKLKKLTIQGKGKQYPEKNITMWANHPLYATITAGQMLDLEIESKDSDKPNPHGGFYKNKTVLMPNTPPNAPQSPQNEIPARTNNIIEFKILPILDRHTAILKMLAQAAGIKVDGGKADYPEMNETNDASGLDEDNSNPF